MMKERIIIFYAIFLLYFMKKLYVNALPIHIYDVCIFIIEKMYSKRCMEI